MTCHALVCLTLPLQGAAAYLAAAVALRHPVLPQTHALLVRTLDSAQWPRMQNLSLALLSLARLQRLSKALWRQHCLRLEAELTKASGALRLHKLVRK